ncbi:hypothetical protein PG988_015822 [Apiospora saccharicola]
MAGNRPRQPWLKDHVNEMYSILTPGVANDYVEGLAIEALGTPSDTARGDNGGYTDNASTPFGFPIPSIGYARNMQEQVCRSKLKPQPAARDTELNTWMGGPALLTEADEGAESPYKVEKVLNGLEWNWPQNNQPQDILNIYGSESFVCPFGRLGLNQCGTCGERSGIHTTECNAGKAKAKEQDPGNDRSKNSPARRNPPGRN